MDHDPQRQALEEPWWVWHDRDITAVFARIKLRQWLARVRAELAANKTRGESPSSVEELATNYLRRDPRNVKRLLAGENGLTDQTLLGLSAALRIPVRDFFPPEADWIAEVVRTVCPAVTSEEAQAYAIYSWHRRIASRNGTSGIRLDEPAVQRVLAEMPEWGRSQKVGEVLLCVARALAPFLKGRRHEGVH